ncbi:MAG: DNA polymerase IV [Anaerovoracaceae bacterium]
MERVILHCDMNGFYASCELLDYPELRDKPMAVCGNPQSRHGIILAKNDLAKSYGIVTAETLWQAKKKCPDLQCVPPHMDKYTHYSKLINEIYLRYTDLVEPFSIDESWLDVTGSQNLFGSGKEIADQIRETVKNELGLTLSAGVSYNKIFAKMGSEYKKPDATTVITKNNFKEILWPMDAGELFFVGKKTAERLKKLGILTIGHIANENPKRLKALLGKSGEMLHQYANGYDNTPVNSFYNREKAKSVGKGMTFKRNLIGLSDSKTAIKALSDNVGEILRKKKLKCNGVKLEIKDPSFKVISRQKQLSSPSNISTEIYNAAMEIYKSSWPEFEPIRLISVTGINLTDKDEDEQLSIFMDSSVNRAKNEKLDKAIDSLKNKYGEDVISSGSKLKNDIF